MTVIAIEEFFIDSTTARLHVKPALAESSDYSLIWRDASSVRWEDRTRSLHTLLVQGWTPIEEFQQIRKAVRGEYGDRLIVTPRTKFTGVPPALAAALQAEEV